MVSRSLRSIRFVEIMFACSLLGACQALLAIDDSPSAGSDAGIGANTDASAGTDATTTADGAGPANDGAAPSDVVTADVPSGDASLDVGDASLVLRADFEDSGPGDFVFDPAGGSSEVAWSFPTIGSSRVWSATTTTEKASGYLRPTAPINAAECDLWVAATPGSAAVSVLTIVAADLNFRRQVEVSDMSLRVFDYASDAEAPLGTITAQGTWIHVSFGPGGNASLVRLGAQVDDGGVRSLDFDAGDGGYWLSIGPNGSDPGRTLFVDDIVCIVH